MVYPTFLPYETIDNLYKSHYLNDTIFILKGEKRMSGSQVDGSNDVR